MSPAGRPFSWTGPPQDCLICGDKFIPRHPTARYCPSCRPTPLWRQCERDGWICHICLRSIDKRLRGSITDPMSPSIDHVVPLADPEGPGDVPENRRAAHLRCNMRKGNRPLTPELRERLAGDAA